MDKVQEKHDLMVAADIVKRYGKEKALDKVGIAVRQGEIACVIGPNGSGKSTLLTILAGLLRPDEGQVLYQGKPFAKNRSGLQKIGFVPQQDSLFLDLSVKENMAFWASAAKVSLKSALARPVIQQLELEEMMKKRVAHLSGGMRRRVAVGVALVANPSLLILDEPFAGLDLFHKYQLTQQLLNLRKSGVTILYTSHNADEIVPLSDTVFLLLRGKMALYTPVEALPKEQGELDRYLLNLIKGETTSV